MVELRPDGGWDLYTAGPPAQLGLWRDTHSVNRTKREGILGWLGLKPTKSEPFNGNIEASEVRPLDFVGDNASNRERYREVSLPPETQVKPWKATHYEVSMKFQEAGMVESRSKIRGVTTCATDSLPFDFGNFADRVKVQSPTGELGKLRRTEAGISVEQSFLAQQEFNLELSFQGHPQPVSHPAVPADLGWLTNDASTITFNGVERSSSWLLGDDSPANKAIYDFRVEVPKGHFAVANGALVEATETESGRMFHYRSRFPMASYLASVNCFDEKTYTKTEVSSGFEVVHPRGMEEQVRNEFANHSQMMDFLTKRLGPYPFETYGAIVTDLHTDTYSSRFTDGEATFEADLGYQVAFEAQTRPIYPRGAIKGFGDFEETLIHELAHQWYGNAVTKASEQDIWVNEAFPSYCGALWREKRFGREALDAEMKSIHDRLSDHQFKDTMAKPDRDRLFSLENYGRMTLSMHALRCEVGDEQFYTTLKGVLEAHKYTSISVEQMATTADELNGGRLKDFFKEWLHTTRIPAIPQLSQPLRSNQVPLDGGQ